MSRTQCARSGIPLNSVGACIRIIHIKTYVYRLYRPKRSQSDWAEGRGEKFGPRRESEGFDEICPIQPWTDLSERSQRCPGR